MDVGSARVVLTDDQSSTCIAHDCWNALRFRTKVKWEQAGHIVGAIAHQLDGISSAHLKNPPDEHVVAFRDWAWGKNLPLLKVGGHLSLAKCVSVLSVSEQFVGACSGMSLLALSVGVPTTVVEYALVAPFWYGPEIPALASDLPAFMRWHERSPDDSDAQPEGIWRSGFGGTITLARDGGAAWVAGDERLLGCWDRTKTGARIGWDNGYAYNLGISPRGPSMLQEISPSGEKRSGLARRMIQ